MEGQRLSAIEQEISENRNGVHLDQNTAQQLHNRFLKKYEDNYLGHFRPVEHKIPREEFEDAHIRRLLQDAETLVEKEPSADSEGEQNVSDGHQNPDYDTQDHPPAEDHPVVKEGHESDHLPVKDEDKTEMNDKQVDAEQDPEVLAAEDPKVNKEENEEVEAPKVKNETKDEEK